MHTENTGLDSFSYMMAMLGNQADCLIYGLARTVKHTACCPGGADELFQANGSGAQWRIPLRWGPVALMA